MEDRDPAPENTGIRVRKATGEETLGLWRYPDVDTAVPTARFFHEQIADGNAVFWALDDSGEIVGELYAFLKLEDEDFADGHDTAYLCAFRIKDEYRGQGYGSRLMKTALTELKENGFRYATIGVGSDDLHNISLYRHFGFLEKVKDCHDDPCALDENGQPVYEEAAWWLLKKEL